MNTRNCSKSMLRFAGVATLGASLSCAAFAGDFPLVYRALSHPNGTASADQNAVDNKDYGLRLDRPEQGINTFRFVDVTMTFLNPPNPDQSTVVAVLEGVIAHLQSSDGGVLGYNVNSGYDAEDQVYHLRSEFRLIGDTGDWDTQPLGYADMLNDLLAAGLNPANRLTYALNDTTMTPLFAEPRVFTGPLVYDEKPGSDDSPTGESFYLETRHRLDPAFFPSPEWDVIGAAGWLEPAIDQPGAPQNNDFLFYLVPEPTSLMLLSIGLIAGAGRRRS